MIVITTTAIDRSSLTECAGVLIGDAVLGGPLGPPDSLIDYGPLRWVPYKERCYGCLRSY